MNLVSTLAIYYVNTICKKDQISYKTMEQGNRDRCLVVGWCQGKQNRNVSAFNEVGFNAAVSRVSLQFVSIIFSYFRFS